MSEFAHINLEHAGQPGYWPQHTADGYLVGEICDHGGPQPNNTADMDDWPEPKPGFLPRKKNGKKGWEQVENHKGKQGYLNGEPHTINDYGPLPDGWSDTPPPLSMEEARVSALETLRLKKWEMKDAGITVNGVAIDTDDKGQATLAGAMLNCLAKPSYTANWKTSAVDEHGKAVWMTIGADLIMPLCQAMTDYTQACFDVEAAKQNELVALQNVEAIQAWLETELETGWPSREIVLG